MTAATRPGPTTPARCPNCRYGASLYRFTVLCPWAEGYLETRRCPVCTAVNITESLVATGKAPR